MKIATIDIGTNSVLLLIVEKKQDHSLNILADEAIITRIGEGLGQANQFLSSGMERTLNCLKRYRILCDQHRVEKIIAVGTAAFRKAANAKEFVAQVKKECGFEVEVISGKREARLTWKAASTDFGGDIIVVDIGGGSTEIILSEKQLVSLPVGSVFLTENFCHSDPISEDDYQKICNTIEEQLNSLKLKNKNVKQLIATAGTATTLGAIQKKMMVYKHHEIHGLQLSLTEIKKILVELKSKTVAERKKIPGLEPLRADVILAGTLLLQKISEYFGFDVITISDRGVRWGLVYG